MGRLPALNRNAIEMMVQRKERFKFCFGLAISITPVGLGAVLGLYE